jgi:hypothetical protein
VIPVSQSKLYAPDAIHNGNCFAATLASLLEIPLWMVPPFEDMFSRSDWRDRVDKWLDRMFHLQLVRLEGHETEVLPEFYIACGLSPRGVGHSVIYRRGALAHDPHPSGAGIAGVERTYHLIRNGLFPALDASLRDRCATKAAQLIEPLRAKARELGYALAVHGSLSRDIDLVAAPWTETSVSADALVDALAIVAGGWREGEGAGLKPHGRTAFVIHLGGGPYLDVSVMPRLDDERAVVAFDTFPARVLPWKE